VMSHQAELVATPPGRGIERSDPCQWMVVEVRKKWRRSWRRARDKLPPAESPANTMCSGETGVW